MDFFGFHPLYVVILLALALIIFGPSRLPQMGAQLGKLVREFQAAREGLTAQMREAMDAPTDTETAATPAPAPEAEGPMTRPLSVGMAPETSEEPEPESAVAVLDPPADPDAAEADHIHAVAAEPVTIDDAASSPIVAPDPAPTDAAAAAESPVPVDSAVGTEAAPDVETETAPEPEPPLEATAFTPSSDEESSRPTDGVDAGEGEGADTVAAAPAGRASEQHAD